MHTVVQKQKLLARVKRIRGQLEAVERALESDAACDQLMHQLAGIRGAVAGLTAEVIEDHVHNHLVDVERYPNALNTDAAVQLMEVFRTYFK